MFKVFILIACATFLVALKAHPFNPNEESQSSSEVKETPSLQSENQEAKNNSNDSTQAYVQESYIQILLPGIPLLNTTQLESLLNITTNLNNTEGSEQTVSPLVKGPNVREIRDVYNKESKELSEEKYNSSSNDDASKNSKTSALPTGPNVRDTRDAYKQDSKDSSELSEEKDSSSSKGSSENYKAPERSPLQTETNVRDTRDVYKEDSKELSEKKDDSSSSEEASENSKTSERTLLQTGPNDRETRDSNKQDSQKSSEEKNDSASSEGSSEISKPSQRSPLQTGPNIRETRDANKQDSQKSSEEKNVSSFSKGSSEISKPSQRSPLQTVPNVRETRDAYTEDSENLKPSEKGPASSLNENVDHPPAASAQNHFEKISNEKATYGSTGVTPDQPLLGRDAREVVDSVEERSQSSTEKEPGVFVTPQNTASTGFQANLKEATSSSSSERGGESSKISSTE